MDFNDGSLCACRSFILAIESRPGSDSVPAFYFRVEGLRSREFLQQVTGLCLKGRNIFLACAVRILHKDMLHAGAPERGDGTFIFNGEKSAIYLRKIFCPAVWGILTHDRKKNTIPVLPGKIFDNAYTFGGQARHNKVTDQQTPMQEPILYKDRSGLPVHFCNRGAGDSGIVRSA